MTLTAESCIAAALVIVPGMLFVVLMSRAIWRERPKSTSQQRRAQQHTRTPLS